LDSLEKLAWGQAVVVHPGWPGFVIDVGQTVGPAGGSGENIWEGAASLDDAVEDVRDTTLGELRFSSVVKISTSE
jgi:hypothetical protein